MRFELTPRFKSAFFSFLAFCFGLGLTAGVLEFASWALMHSPGALRDLPAKTLSHFRNHYQRSFRKVIQFDPAMAQFDSELFYTLRPGRFVFSNLEFASDFQVNSLGLRDSEAALHKPEIIVLGDSFAMGWGVQQNETFAKRLETLTGKKVLNGGVSSYGTVREMLLLNRLDTSNLKTLIIQYCDNDEGENRTFFEQGNRHKSGTLVEYQEAQKIFEQGKRYYLGRNLRLFYEPLRPFLKPFQKANAATVAASDVDLFINALVKVPKKDFTKIHIVFLKLEPYAENSKQSEQRFREAFLRTKSPSWVSGVRVIPIADNINSSHYYTLDDHLTEKGHSAVAQLLAHSITSQNH